MSNISDIAFAFSFVSAKENINSFCACVNEIPDRLNILNPTLGSSNALPN